MDYDHQSYNGWGGSGMESSQQQDERKRRNYKLLSDPMIEPGTPKVYRFDGVVPGDVDPEPIFVRDPRSRMKRWNKRTEPMDMPVPKFKFDANYVGTILPKEVTFTNLNDNIHNEFLRNMCTPFGVVEEAKVYFHPRTKKHLGIGKVLFTSTRSARICSEKLNQTSKMGMIINAFVDPFGKERTNLIDDLTIDKAPPVPPPSATPRPPSPPTPQKSRSADDPRRRASRESTGKRPPLPRDLDHDSLPPTPGSKDYGHHRGSNSRDLLSHHGNHDGDSHYGGGAPLPPLPGGPPLPKPPIPPHGDDGGLQPPLPPHPLDAPIKSSGRKDGPRYIGDDRDEYDNNYEPRHRRSRGGRDRHRDDYNDNRSRDDYRNDYRNEYESDSRDSFHRDGSSTRLSEYDDYNDRYPPGDSHYSRYDRRNDRNSRRQDYDEDSFEDNYNNRDDRGRYGKSRNRHGGEDSRRNKHDRRRHRRDRDDFRRRHSDDRRHPRDEHPDDLQQPPLPPQPHELHGSESPTAPEPPAEEPEPPPPEPPPETPVTEDAPRLDLESRIQSLLGGLAASPTHDDAQEGNDGPPIPGDGPPLPPEDLPPLPDEPAPPPLPPEPDDHYHNNYTNGDLDSRLGHFARMYMPNGGGEDDDRMSMSSMGSGGEAEKIELAHPTHMPPPGPPMPPMPPLLWPPPTQGPPPPHNQAFHNHMTNNMYNQGFPPPPFMDPALMQQMGPGFQAPMGPVFTELDEQREQYFVDSLDAIINQLKMIMKKDLCKKMVQETAFRTYDEWLAEQSRPGRKTQEKTTKEVPFTQYSSPSKKDGTPAEGENAPPAVPVSSTTVPSQPNKPKVADGMASSIAALFERKDGAMGPAFGMGGLLGFSGGFPKMPSFRKKIIKPPTPPPEEDEEEEEDVEKDQTSVGPRTPAESEDEKMSEGSVESELRDMKEREQRKKKIAIYSSDSSDDDYEEEDEEEEEDDEESESEGSDVDIEGSSPIKPPTPPPSPKKRKNKFQRQADIELPGLTVERATFPVGDSDDEEADLSQSQASDSSDSESLSDLGNVGSDAASDATPLPSDAEDMVTSDVEVEERNVFDRFGKDRVARAEEEDAALTLLRMHEVSAEEKERQEQERKKKEEEIRLARQNVQREHSYMYKGDTKSRPKQPLPEFADIESDFTDSASEGEPDMIPCLPFELTHDHQYCTLYHPIDYAEQYRKTREKFLGHEVRREDYYAEPIKVEITDIAADVDINTGEVIKKFVNRVQKRTKGLSDITNIKGSRELASLLPEVEKPKAKFKARTVQEQVQIAYEFLVKGIDQEDRNYLKRRYEELLQDDSPQTAWLNNVHWVDHTHTAILDPPVKKRRKAEEEMPKHETGCARTEGKYAITHAQKKTYLRHAIGVNAYNDEASLESLLSRIEKTRKLKNQELRDKRSESRRWQTALGQTGGDVSDLVKFNQLKFRKKEVKFAKSGIHNWGLFALEHIESDEMVIEYVGQKIRQSVADLRERRYEQQGIGSSYLFRIDSDEVVDATKYGSVARFINHSCNPNCYAKIITVENEKKIVIYSKRDIAVNEEITYDYKFPLEDEKIPCLCGTVSCRGSLN